MIRKRLSTLTVTLALCGLSLGARLTTAQDLVRSIVVSVDAAGRIVPASKPAPGDKRYWADLTSQSIQRSNLDGSGAEQVAGPLHDPYGLSFDPSSGLLLWTSSGDETVQILPAGGGAPITLQSEFEEPYAIVVAADAVQVAYMVDGNQVVKITQFSTSDVEEREVLFSFDSTTQPVHGLALDEKNGVLYVGDGNGQMTWRIRLADKVAETLAFVDEGFSTPTLAIKGAR